MIDGFGGDGRVDCYVRYVKGSGEGGVEARLGFGREGGDVGTPW